MAKCKLCGGEVVAEGYEKNFIRFKIDDSGDFKEMIETENEETVIDFYECLECGNTSRTLSEVVDVQEDEE